MVGRLTLDQVVGVRVPAPQPYESPALAGLLLSWLAAAIPVAALLVPVRVPIAAHSAPWISASIRGPVSRWRSIFLGVHLERKRAAGVARGVGARIVGDVSSLTRS